MTEEQEQMVYLEEKPDIGALANAYQRTLTDNEEFFSQCLQNRQDRRNEWPGKTPDQRKRGVNAFPWDGASDSETNVIGERIDAYVALGRQALDRSHIKAYPTKMEGMPRAATVSAFLKWMASSYIPNFSAEMERAWNFGLEKGLMVSYVGWKKEERTFLQDMTLEQIAAASPEIADAIAGGQDDDTLTAMLQQAFPRLKAKRAKKALRDLRNTGAATLAVSRPSVNRPCVEALMPDGEVFFPSWCQNSNESPYVFWRRRMTAQQIEKEVAANGWDADWAKAVIERCGGMGTMDLLVDTEVMNRTATDVSTFSDHGELYLVVYAFQRLIDEEDGSEGIYRTVFSPYLYGQSIPGVLQDFAKTELLNGYDDYPFVVTRLDESSKCMYDVKAFPEMLRGPQWGIKVERDSRIDRASMATLPEMTGPPGRPPGERGPGRYIPVRRQGEYAYQEPPRFDPGSIEVENTLTLMADRAVGLDYNIPNAPVRQQFLVNKLLAHARDCLKLAYKCFQRFGPDQVFFNVTGFPDPVTLDNIDEEDFNITLNFDTLSTDPETMKARAEQMASLMSFDKTGRMDNGRFLEFLAYSIDPAFAEHILLPADEATRKMQDAITNDFAKLFGGVAIGPQPNGSQITMQMGQAWLQQPDVAGRLQNDEAFAKRVQDYFGQVQFQMQQAENAQIGRIGTAPTDFQGTNIQ